MIEKCEHCGKEFVIKTFKRYYVYKLKEHGSDKNYFFCSYSCMRTSKKENPEKYRKRVVW